MGKYRSKVVEIEAIQWNGVDSESPLPGWLVKAIHGLGGSGSVTRNGPQLVIHTLEGVMVANPSDWVICGTEGEIYPCKSSVFERKYEAVDG